MDLVPASEVDSLKERVLRNLQDKVAWVPTEIVCVSALDQENRGVLQSLLKRLLERTSESGSAMISQLRQKECLDKALVSLLEAQKGLEGNSGEEVIALCLREALESVLSILGKRLDEEVLDRIFKEFCLGK